MNSQTNCYPLSYENKKVRFVSNEKAITVSVSHDTEKKIWKIHRIVLRPFICKPPVSSRVWQAMQDKGVSTKCSNCPYYRGLPVETAEFLWRQFSTKSERVFSAKFGTFGIMWYRNQLNTKIYLLQNGIIWYRKNNASYKPYLLIRIIMFRLTRYPYRAIVLLKSREPWLRKNCTSGIARTQCFL